VFSYPASLGGQPVDVRSLNQFISVAAEFGSQIVNDDKKDVGTRGVGRLGWLTKGDAH